jgi:hypothetical protein
VPCRWVGWSALPAWLRDISGQDGGRKREEGEAGWRRAEVEFQKGRRSGEGETRAVNWSGLPIPVPAGDLVGVVVVVGVAQPYMG